MNKRLGIIGVGHLAGYLVDGLMRHESAPEMVLSPRGSDHARRLSEKYGLRIANSNEDVVKSSEIVLLATRPPQLIAAASGLPWREGQTAISIAAGIALFALADAVSPASVVRALPITAAKIGESPTCLFPENLEARQLFEKLGTVHVFDDEETYELASIQGVIFSAFHAGIRSLANWLAASGLEPGTAREITARALRATCGMVLEHPNVDFDHMVDEYAIEGSLTRTALQELEKNGGLQAWPDAMEAALIRCRKINRESQA